MSDLSKIRNNNGASNSANDEEPSASQEGHELIELALKGVEIIKSFVKDLPKKPGVYRMLDENKNVLYVGKAVNLKNRVTSYTRLANHPTRIANMILKTAYMEFTITSNETDALLLEANLIKRHKPYYNILMRDDKSFPYILISHEHKAARLLKHRGARKIKGEYFGPFASVGSVNSTLYTLQKIFLLRTCTDSVYENRTRPCLLYQIKRCAAPCTGEISLKNYEILVNEALKLLRGKSKEVQGEIVEKMEKAAAIMDYEKAASYRDRLKALTKIQASQKINPKKMSEADIFAIYAQSAQACIQVFFFRSGLNLGNRAYYIKADDKDNLTHSQMLESFIPQFYDNKPTPKLIITSDKLNDKKLLEEAFSLRDKHKVKIMMPKRGEKKHLLNQSLLNAKQALQHRLAQTMTQKKLLKQLQDKLKLECELKRIEVYDNSHIQGSNSVGVMIVVGEEGYLKNQYRKFNIKTSSLNNNDDYAMMREVIYRRFKRSKANKADNEQTDNDVETSKANSEFAENEPDLLIIDGGKGQLSAVAYSLAELELKDINYIGISKSEFRNQGGETIHIPKLGPLKLKENDPLLYFLQRIRDESHRFAIGTHRKKRSAAITKSTLDDIPSIGAARKRQLLNSFGSAKEVSRASLDDLKAVKGISPKLAKTIYDYFNPDENLYPN